MIPRALPLLALSILFSPTPARACGCLAPPDPTNNVVQSGERILFAARGQEVTAHIQLSFADNGSTFVWLLPLPSVPEVSVGKNELFEHLAAATQPRFNLIEMAEPCGAARSAGAGCGWGCERSSGRPNRTGYGVNGAPNPVVLENTVGPYDYGILRADDQSAVLDWLNRNRYFVPTGTQNVLAPYVHPGAYFLAVKLSPSRTLGDLTPIVVRYASDLPMIPIILTSVASGPSLPIEVWLLGPARAIPRNYYHTILDDALIDWQNGAANYNDLVRRAVAEAPRHHSFVTQFAGDSSVVQGLDPAETELFRGLPKLTRLFTILSPDDMTEDPVFSFNPDLEDQSSTREATLMLGCRADDYLTTPEGLVVPFANGKPTVAAPLPASLRTEILRESGPPIILEDHRPAIETALGHPPHPTDDALFYQPLPEDAGTEDATISRRATSLFPALALFPLALFLLLRRRR